MTSTIVYTSSCLSWNSNLRNISSRHFISISSSEKGCSTAKASVDSSEKVTEKEENERLSLKIGRRSAMVSAVSLISSAAFVLPGESLAVVKQGLLAGRVPGLSEPDEQGWRTYQRPEDKSGGHGVGWSPIIPYAFRVPEDWDEVPVSIADLGGTEIDLRFASPKQGRLFVIVAPCKRFSDATAAGNRLYLFSVTGNGLQWKKHYKDLKRIAESFRVI